MGIVVTHNAGILAYSLFLPAIGTDPPRCSYTSRPLPCSPRLKRESGTGVRDPLEEKFPFYVRMAQSEAAGAGTFLGLGVSRPPETLLYMYHDISYEYRHLLIVTCYPIIVCNLLLYCIQSTIMLVTVCIFIYLI